MGEPDIKAYRMLATTVATVASTFIFLGICLGKVWLINLAIGFLVTLGLQAIAKNYMVLFSNTETQKSSAGEQENSYGTRTDGSQNKSDMVTANKKAEESQTSPKDCGFVNPTFILELDYNQLNTMYQQNELSFNEFDIQETVIYKTKEQA